MEIVSFCPFTLVPFNAASAILTMGRPFFWFFASLIFKSFPFVLCRFMTSGAIFYLEKKTQNKTFNSKLNMAVVSSTKDAPFYVFT